MNRNWLGAALALAVGGCSADTHKNEDGGLGGTPGNAEAEDAGLGSADAGVVSPGADQDAASESDSGAATDLDAAQQPAADASDVDSEVALDAGGGTPEFPLDGGLSASDASAPDAAPPTIEQFCSGQGPVIKVPGPSAGAPYDVCTGTVARQRFKNALCTCENADIRGYLNTGSFSASKDEPGTFTKAGGAVGINGSMGIISAGYTDVGGSLRIHESVTFGGYVKAYGDLELNQGAIVAGLVDVRRDAKFREDMVLLGDMFFGRDLYTRPWKWEPPLWSQLLHLAGKHYKQDFTLDKPCACEPEQLLDVDAIVRHGKTNNDNVIGKVSPSLLSGINFFRRVELPCGRYYLDEISGVGDIHIKVTGRTALYVGGNVANIGHLDIEVAPQAELDLFIAGNLVQIGYNVFGDVNRPSAVRVYVGGDGDILFQGYQPFGANLYAPRSYLHSDGFIDARGSLFVRELDVNGYLKVNYDRDILDQGDDDACKPPKPPVPDAGVPDASTPDAAVPDASVPDASVPDASEPPPPPPECTWACDELCGQQTCKNGMCAGCTSDSDCCEPLVCYPDGRCGPMLL